MDFSDIGYGTLLIPGRPLSFLVPLPLIPRTILVFNPFMYVDTLAVCVIHSVTVKLTAKPS